jgi:UDP-glucose 4-epimerase
MTVTITGQNSFIGKTFISHFSDQFAIKEIDTKSIDPSKMDFNGSDVVFHVAAIVHQSRKISRDTYFDVNRDLAFKIAQKAKADGVKQFVFMSTVKVYGECSGNLIYTANSECHPIDDYGLSKLEAEKLILSLNDSTFVVSIIRSPLVYGPGVTSNMLSLFKMVSRIPILPFKNVNNHRSMVFVLNLIHFIKCVIDKRIPGIFLPSDGKPVSCTELILMISAKLHKHPKLLHIPVWSLKVLSVLFPGKIEKLFGSFVIDTETSFKVTGFVPVYSFEHGIEATAVWFQSIN